MIDFYTLKDPQFGKDERLNNCIKIQRLGIRETLCDIYKKREESHYGGVN